MKHRRLTREMLLPLPAQKARALSLQYHLALSVLAAGHGGFDQAARLLQAICHAHLIADSGDADAGPLDEAESALDVSVSHVDAGGAWTVTDAEGAAIASALSIHDRLTAREPYRRFVAAWAQMQQLGCELQGKSA